MDGMPLTEKQIKTFYDNPELHTMLKNLKKERYLTYEYPRKLEEGRRIPDETKKKGYNIVAGKLSFEFSKILES